MAIDIFPKAWSNIPPITARAIPGHSLCPKFGFLFDGVGRDIVQNIPIISAGTTPGTWSPGAVRGVSGKVREHTATTDFDRINVDANLIVPTQNFTVVVAHQKTDGT